MTVRLPSHGGSVLHIDGDDERSGKVREIEVKHHVDDRGAPLAECQAGAGGPPGNSCDR